LLHLQNPVAVFKTVHAARSRESLARANRRPVHTQMAKKPDVVPASELPKPHPKALKALEKLRLQDANTRALLDRLGSVGFVVAGDNTELNWLIAQQLAKRISYFSVSTLRILSGLHKLDLKTTSREALVEKLGSEQKLIEEEAKILHGLRNEKRVVIATIADGATGQHSTYRDLWGAFIIHLDMVDGTAAPKPPSPARQVLQSNAEVKVEMKKGKGFSDTGITTEQQAKAAVDQFMINMVNFMNSNPNIVNKKREYVHYGCRGDWPEIKPPEWSPVLDALGREAPVVLERPPPPPSTSEPVPEQPANSQTIDVQPS